MPSFILISGIPLLSSVKVFINDVYQKDTRKYSKFSIKPGKHLIRISKECYFDYEETVTVDKNKTT